MNQDCILEQENTNSEEGECISAVKIPLCFRKYACCFFCFHKIVWRTSGFTEPSKVKEDQVDGPAG